MVLPDGRRRGGAFAVAALAIVLACTGWLVSGSDAVVAPAVTDEPAGLQSAAAPSPTAVVAGNGPSEQRSDAVHGGIRGRVLDAAGAPLPAFRVSLIGRPDGQRKELEPWFLADTTSDALGSFEFGELGKGDYRVQLTAVRHVTQSVRLAVGEQQQVELRLDLVAVSGTLHRDGKVSDHYRVGIKDAAGQYWHAGPGDSLPRPFTPGYRANPGDEAERCVIRVALAPGRYRLQVLHPSLGSGTGGEHMSLNEHELVVPSGVPTSRFSFPIGGTELVVAVRLPNGERVREFGVDLNRADPGPAEYFPVSSPQGAPARIEDVPPGRWCLHVHSPYFTAAPEREFEASAAVPRVEIEVDALPAESVFLQLRAGGAREVSPPAELLPPLLAGGAALPCRLLDRSLTRSKAQLVWQSVPRGPAAVQWVDRVLDGEHVFLPFEPLPTASIGVAAGVRNELAVDVMPRACVDLCACDRGGREDPEARLAVSFGTRRVRGAAGFAAQRWKGWLPVGDYRIVITRGGSEREQPLRVGRADITLRLRP